jgi:acyl carrier protein phosphodiesterase
MNYFAQLALSQLTVESTVGNLLGDFARGINREVLTPPVNAGLDNHRAVDRFTDSHQAIKHLKQLFLPERRRFAGIALDVYFDHLLMKHWSLYYSSPLHEVIDVFYRRMTAGQPIMPSKIMRNTTLRMVSYDWFGSYREIDSVAHALDRIAGRIRYKNRFDNAIEDIIANQHEIEATFKDFFPELKAHITRLELES